MAIMPTVMLAMSPSRLLHAPSDAEVPAAESTTATFGPLLLHVLPRMSPSAASRGRLCTAGEGGGGGGSSWRCVGVWTLPRGSGRAAGGGGSGGSG